jgi:hypothetical protein
MNYYRVGQESRIEQTGIFLLAELVAFALPALLDGGRAEPKTKTHFLDPEQPVPVYSSDVL